MFAPHCPTCGHRVLLGAGRIVAADIDGQPCRIAVRCFCGTVLDALQETPRSAPADAPAA